MCKVMKKLMERSGVFVAITGKKVTCENPVCCNQAVVKDRSTNRWLCQDCYDALYDATWGFGYEAI